MQADALTNAPHAADAPQVDGLPEVLGRRNRAPDLYASGAAPAPSTEPALSDLEGLLPAEELMEAQAALSLQRLLQQPHLSFLAAYSIPPFNMYA